MELLEQVDQGIDAPHAWANASGAAPLRLRRSPPLEDCMMEESAEQVRGRRVRDMGPDLGAVFNELWDDIAWLHAKWNLYRQLYARSAVG